MVLSLFFNARSWGLAFCCITVTHDKKVSAQSNVIASPPPSLATPAVSYRIRPLYHCLSCRLQKKRKRSAMQSNKGLFGCRYAMNIFRFTSIQGMLYLCHCGLVFWSIFACSFSLLPVSFIIAHNHRVYSASLNPPPALLRYAPAASGSTEVILT